MTTDRPSDRSHTNAARAGFPGAGIPGAGIPGTGTPGAGRRRARFASTVVGACVAGLTLLSGPVVAAAAPGDDSRPTIPALTTERRDQPAESTSFPVVPVAAAAAVAAAGGVAGWWVLRHRRHGSNATVSHSATGSFAAPAPAAAPGCLSAPVAPTAGQPLAPPAPSMPDARIGLLVNELIDLRDRLTSEAIRTEIASVLERVGVSEVLVDPGTRFDPIHHLGVDTATATDPTWDHLVAATEAPGYRTGTQLLRRPSVVVYRFES